MAAVVNVPIEKLRPHPANPRRGDVVAIMRSLERFGQVKPIIVQRSTGFVVAGNHTMEAAKRLGWTTINAMVMEMDDDKARAYLIADNRTSDRGSYDKSALTDLLGDVLATSLDGTGWTEEEVQEAFGEGGEEKKPGKLDDAKVKEVEEKYDPLREIVLLVPLSEMDHFAAQIAGLQKHWETRTTVEAIRKVIDLAYNALPKPEEAFVEPVKANF